MPLKRFLTEHEVSTAYLEGWGDLQNGDLLAAAESRFDLFITTDKNLRYQQNLSGRRLAILVLPTTSWPAIQPHGETIASAAETMQPAEYRELVW